MSSLRARLERLDAVRARHGGRVGSLASEPGDPRDEGANAPVVAAEPETLEFERVSGARGTRWRRSVWFGEGARAGEVRLGEVLAIDPRHLGLLAVEPRLTECAPERALFLDVESSGLGGGTGNRAFLIGLMGYEPSERAFWFEQLFLRELDDEAAMLEGLIKHLERASHLVTYNGKSFDIPLLETRTRMALGPAAARSFALPHVDLLHVARRVHAARSFRKTLSVVEREVLGFDRGPDVSGEEVAHRYARFLGTGDERELREVVTHNQHDVVSLVALYGYYGRPLPVNAGDVEAARGEGEVAPRIGQSAVRDLGNGLEASELAAMARHFRRKGANAEAAQAAELAVGTLPGSHLGALAFEPLFVRAELKRRAGDRTGALADLETLATTRDEAALRLALAKLYEHHARDHERALAIVRQGTGEEPEAEQRRASRLARKAADRGSMVRKER